MVRRVYLDLATFSVFLRSSRVPVLFRRVTGNAPEDGCEVTLTLKPTSGTENRPSETPSHPNVWLENLGSAANLV